jgi:hypothetical protein
MNFMMAQLVGILKVTPQLTRSLGKGYYWPTLFKCSHTYERKFLECQKSTGRERKVPSPMQPMIIEFPFKQWGLDMIREINPKSS